MLTIEDKEKIAKFMGAPKDTPLTDHIKMKSLYNDWNTLMPVVGMIYDYEPEEVTQDIKAAITDISIEALQQAIIRYVNELIK